MNDRLLDEDIFIVPLDDFKGHEGISLVYAPLAGRFLLADDEGLSSIDEKVLSQLRIEGDKFRFFSKVRKANDLQKMSVLPNHTCNFSCSYCYSAKGRSNVVLDKEKLDRALEFFINPHRLKERNISISFIGGGEPLLSWGLVKHGIEYSSSLASKHGFNLIITLITNGSVISDDIISTLKEYTVLPDVSFDIIEEAQNKNRGQFNKVCKTIDSLCQAGIVPSVNATITPDTVLRMSEMVDFMNLRFSAVKNMVFEPVVSTDIFPSPLQLKEFYSLYLDNFFKAKSLAQANGKLVTCRIYKNVSSLLERGCPSKLALTPQGDISICYCVSSPREASYAKRVFGKVTADGVEIDDKRFSEIHGIDVHSFEKCQHCFAKWHCGGGCMCPNDNYDDAHLEEVCRFTRNMVIRSLLEKIRSNT